MEKKLKMEKQGKKIKDRVFFTSKILHMLEMSFLISWSGWQYSAQELFPKGKHFLTRIPSLCVPCA